MLRRRVCMRNMCKSSQQRKPRVYGYGTAAHDSRSKIPIRKHWASDLESEAKMVRILLTAIHLRNAAAMAMKK